MCIQSRRITNLRCFRTAELTFQYPGREGGSAALPNVNLPLGINGSGKTSVLRAIALATLAPRRSRLASCCTPRMSSGFPYSRVPRYWTNRYIDLETTRAPTMEDVLATLARKAGSGDSQAAMEYLRKLAEGMDVEIGSTRKT